MMASPLSSQKTYLGRFAPSPSGPLHFGSLVCALASYLDAKANSGAWFLRIEDIDPPREQPGADDAIKRTLEAHGLYWDGKARYQSERSEAYRAILNQLEQHRLIYPCNCTRARLTPLKGRYDGHCKIHPPADDKPCAKRLKVAELPPPYHHYTADIAFEDRFYGYQHEDITQVSGDFIVHRKDGLFAYQLAVVVDDIDQGVTDIVRGDDLLDTTCRQIFLTRILGHQAPTYAHIPVIRDEQGNKLSKQNHAQGVVDALAIDNLKRACNALWDSLGWHWAGEDLALVDDTEAILKIATDAWPATLPNG